MIGELGAGDPRQVGRYRLLGRVGAGGMGVVYLASSPDDDVVAVKLIRADLASDPAFRARFAREVAAARRVGGVCTAPVRDADLDTERPWVVTDFVPGPNLADLVARHGPLDHSQQQALAAGLAAALQAVHAAGVVHRDLKPSNVLCSPDGPRLIDFGIAQAADVTSATLTGQIIGSPAWMAPEQIRGSAATSAVDLFALGSVLVFAATGRSPFGEGQFEAVMYRVLNEPPDLGAPGGLDPVLRPAVEHLLEKDPARRGGTGEVLAAVSVDGPDPAGAVTALIDRTWVLPDAEKVAAAAAAAVPELPARPRRRRRKQFLAGAAAAAVIAAVAALFLLASPSSARHLATAGTAVTVAVPSTTVTVPPTTAAPATAPATAAPTTAAPVTAAPTAVAASTPGPAALPGLVVCDGQPEIEPTQIYYCSSACSSSMTGITWTTWNAQQAIGYGTLHTNSGIPNCGQGTITDTPDSRDTLSAPENTVYCNQNGQIADGVLFTQASLYSNIALPVFRPPCG